MESKLVKILLDNKDKILESRKFDDNSFNTYINSLKEAESVRDKIINMSLESCSVDVQKLKNQLSLSEDDISLNVEYLKELGSLRNINIKPKVFKNRDMEKGIFPNVSMVHETDLCCACGIYIHDSR